MPKHVGHCTVHNQLHLMPKHVGHCTVHNQLHLTPMHVGHYNTWVPIPYFVDAEVQASEGVAHDHLSGGGVPDLLRLIVVALGVGVVMVGGGTLGNRVLSRRKKSHVHLPLVRWRHGVLYCILPLVLFHPPCLCSLYTTRMPIDIFG